jgi:cobalt-precorrin-6B (C15)-methyltransferase
MNKWPFVTPGIPDEYFLREKGIPMTRNEVRVISLSKLRLFPEAVVYDIGAGTGSVAIECKILLPRGRVLAVEKNPRAIDLILKNCQALGVELEIIAGQAPQCLPALPEADRIFIGGSGGQLQTILETCHNCLKPGGWMVMNSVSITALPVAYSFFREQGYYIDAVQVNISANTKLGGTEIWQAYNPVTVLAAKKGGTG